MKEFRRAAQRLKDRVGDGRDPNRGANEARALLQSASRIDRYVARVQLDSRTYSDWSQIRQDLRTIADIYGFGGDFRDDGYYRRGGYERRDRDDRNRGSIWNLPFPWPRN